MSDEAAVEVAAEDGRDFVTAEDVQATQPQERPEWLQEKFKTPEDLAKAYDSLSQKLGTKEEEIRNALIEEIQQEAFADRPESAGDYQLPDSIDAEDAVDNQLLQWWSNHAYENGFSQEEFEQGIEMYAQALGNDEPDLEHEASQLGENANTRIEAASVFANKFFPEEAIPAIERMCETHEGIIALEVIMEKMKDSNFGGAGEPAPQEDINELRQMMRDPRYNGYDKDPAFVQRVRDGFERIYNK